MAYNLIATTNEDTVVSSYEPSNHRSSEYQSESALEASFIRQLQSQGYEYINIRSESDLLTNLRHMMENLNHYTFSDDEWKRFFTECIAKTGDGIVEKTQRIQEASVQSLRLDDGTTRNLMLIDKKNIHNNRLQVINQYENDGGRNRYDVTILVNGLPLVHIELKRRGVALREAFNQIERYQRDSFWTGCGLFEYVQIFVISNGTCTKYYANTTRINAAKENIGRKKVKTSASFDFTSFWADAKNTPITDIEDFTRTFLTKHTLLNVLTKYCVFTTDRSLLVMRPYQIAATEAIMSQIEIATNYRRYGTIDGGGFVWHSTGSGKTLTSFKAAQLASNLPYVDKVIFVVDRKDLDYQTMCEYDRFAKGCANGNSDTNVLTNQLSNKDEHGNPHEYRIIVTTIQKLSKFIRNNASHPVYNQHVVLIFDECHRSQFGAMHNAIVHSFKKYHIFGFTGTPIFAVNVSGQGLNAKTTEQVFGKKLHAYTVVDAIRDGNVLPFRIDYVKTMEEADDVQDEDVYDIDREAAFNDPKRITLVTKYILDHFNQKTYRGNHSQGNGTVSATSGGFNSILAVSSIPAAKLYYEEFKRQMKDDTAHTLRIATIFSYTPNEGEEDFVLEDENSDDASALDLPSKDFLAYAINDYNLAYHTNFGVDGKQFAGYYKDVSARMKKGDIDLLIVVNMFLTGFDAPCLNTLWVDKNLKMHGLMQAFSRTNRILNSVKTFGNIVCFRNLRARVDESISLFGDSDASGIIVLRKYDDYYNGYDDKNGKHTDGYAELVTRLVSDYPLTDTIVTGEKRQKDFIVLFGSLLKSRNILSSFDEFACNEILTDGDFQDYLSIYQDLRLAWRGKDPAQDKTDINDDVVFETELVEQIEVNIDYILQLVTKYHNTHSNDAELKAAVFKAIASSAILRSKKDLIEAFLAGITDEDDVYAQWHDFIGGKMEQDLAAIIADEKLNDKKTRQYIADAFRTGELSICGTVFDAILPPTSRFGGKRDEKKQRVYDRLNRLFSTYNDIV